MTLAHAAPARLSSAAPRMPIRVFVRRRGLASFPSDSVNRAFGKYIRNRFASFREVIPLSCQLEGGSAIYRAGNAVCGSIVLRTLIDPGFYEIDLLGLKPSRGLSGRLASWHGNRRVSLVFNQPQ